MAFRTIFFKQGFKSFRRDYMTFDNVFRRILRHFDIDSRIRINQLCRIYGVVQSIMYQRMDYRQRLLCKPLLQEFS